MLNIERSVIWKNRDGNSMSYFIPRTTLYEDCKGSGLLMTLQGITGSDYFHPLKLSENNAIITVGEMLPFKGFTGNTLQALINIPGNT